MAKSDAERAIAALQGMPMNGAITLSIRVAGKAGRIAPGEVDEAGEVSGESGSSSEPVRVDGQEADSPAEASAPPASLGHRLMDSFRSAFRSRASH